MTVLLIVSLCAGWFAFGWIVRDHMRDRNTLADRIRRYTR